ncbi:hypothetical protein Bca52824_026998 [Brassica carinata]|uniref:Uncharacterized protein n=1 Tax=Brassica carinata TaxID=52824 RepID=A0A8X7SIP1_BRACI|nr:hypothetical protein Bca52824_026998 [Brassica carinata]
MRVSLAAQIRPRVRIIVLVTFPHGYAVPRIFSRAFRMSVLLTSRVGHPSRANLAARVRPDRTIFPTRVAPPGIRHPSVLGHRLAGLS